MQTKARAREIEDRYYVTLLNSLTLDQIRTALFRLKRDSAPVVKTRSDAIDAVESAGWVEKDLNSILLDIEAKSPTRHCAISHYAGSKPEISDADLFQSLPIGARGIEFRPVHHAKGEGFTSITFEHNLEIREWKAESDDVRRLVVTKIRHPIILRCYDDLKIAAFFFPGFTHGTAQKASERLSYEDVISDLSVALSYKYQTTFKQFPIARAVKYLQAGGSPEVKVIRADMDAPHGTVSLDSPIATNSVNDLLLSFLRPHVSSDIVAGLQGAIRAAITDAHAEHFVIYWCKERVVTRVHLWSFACELMFIWNETESSFRSIDSIIRLLVSVATQADSAEERNVWDFIVSLPQDRVVTQSELVSKGSVSEGDVLSIAIKAVEAGILEYAFRLRTKQLLIDCPNLWSADPATYRAEFKTVSGELIDGRDPRMIEVGFMRPHREGVQA